MTARSMLQLSQPDVDIPSAANNLVRISRNIYYHHAKKSSPSSSCWSLSGIIYLPVALRPFAHSTAAIWLEQCDHSNVLSGQTHHGKQNKKSKRHSVKLLSFPSSKTKQNQNDVKQKWHAFNSYARPPLFLPSLVSFSLLSPATCTTWSSSICAPSTIWLATIPLPLPRNAYYRWVVIAWCYV